MKLQSKQTSPQFKTKIEFEFIPQPPTSGEDNDDEFVVMLAKQSSSKNDTGTGRYRNKSAYECRDFEDTYYTSQMKFLNDS